jgi:nitroreductase
MEFFSVINSRRSVRKFKDGPVDRGDLEKIVAAGIEAPSGCNAQLRRYIIVDSPAVMDRVRSISNALGSAPAAIVLLVEPQGTKFGEFWIQDASAAMENMLLAAVALGYGGCWVEGAVRPNEDLLREVLGVPDNLRVWSLTPIGRPAESPARQPKSEFAEVTGYNGFDES